MELVKRLGGQVLRGAAGEAVDLAWSKGRSGEALVLCAAT